jgi:hypothetical protein
MNDVAAFCLKRFRFHQHFECGLRAESRHALSEPEFKRLGHAMQNLVSVN